MTAEFPPYAYRMAYSDFVEKPVRNGDTRPMPLDERVRNPFINALSAEGMGDINSDRRLYAIAATQAWRIYEATTTQRITAEGRRLRFHYGEITVISLLGANETKKARGRAITLLGGFTSGRRRKKT